ncbi:MAG: hypothetical protein PHZ19_06220 [Candidatus Thermoplasmatota archaeon]|nr:hypothetical protein [Candidatus Thermoplasmatota archaeon]
MFRGEKMKNGYYWARPREGGDVQPVYLSNHGVVQHIGTNSRWNVDDWVLIEPIYPPEGEEKYSIGDMVKLNVTAREEFKGIRTETLERHGTVVGFGRKNGVVRIQWDGTGYTQSWHEKFIRKVSPLDKLIVPESDDGGK